MNTNVAEPVALGPVKTIKDALGLHGLSGTGDLTCGTGELIFPALIGAGIGLVIWFGIGYLIAIPFRGGR
jgi:hypothetical protein